MFLARQNRSSSATQFYSSQEPSGTMFAEDSSGFFHGYKAWNRNHNRTQIIGFIHKRDTRLQRSGFPFHQTWFCVALLINNAWTCMGSGCGSMRHQSLMGGWRWCQQINGHALCQCICLPRYNGCHNLQILYVWIWLFQSELLSYWVGSQHSAVLYRADPVQEDWADYYEYVLNGDCYGRHHD